MTNIYSDMAQKKRLRWLRRKMINDRVNAGDKNLFIGELDALKYALDLAGVPEQVED